MYTLKSSLERYILGCAETIANYQQGIRLLEKLGLADTTDGYVSVLTYTQPKQLSLSIHSEAAGRAVLREVMKSGLVRKLDKEFRPDQKEVRLTGMIEGTEFQLELNNCIPSTCTIEEIEEEVEVEEVPAVAAIPAHIEKRKRRVMKGDCDPFLQPVEQQEQELVEA